MMDKENIQCNGRNSEDVAMELMYMYIKKNEEILKDEDKLLNLYLKFYSTVKAAQSSTYNLEDFILDSLKEVEIKECKC